MIWGARRKKTVGRDREKWGKEEGRKSRRKEEREGERKSRNTNGYGFCGDGSSSGGSSRKN